MNVLNFFLLSCLLIIQSYSAIGNEVIRHNKLDSGKESYQFGVVKLALSYSNKTYDFIESPVYLSQSKLLSDLDSNKIDVAWLGTSNEYEEDYLPIRIPLFKGLLGHRIFLIRKGDQQRFNHIKTLDDFRSFKAGQGASWSDTRILKEAGLNVVTTTKFPNLFPMLDGDRFDYFPRSIYSPWGDMAKYPEFDFTVEENIIFVYPLPAYIFVKKDNIALKQAIESGLYKAIEDGSFDKYFYNHPMIKQGLEQSNLKQRRILKLENLALSAETPLEDERLWFNINSYNL